MPHKFIQSLRTLLLALILSIGVSYAYATWSTPASTPPGGNIDAPVNIGNGTQYKSGALGIGGLVHGYTDAIFDGAVGIGNTAQPCTNTNAGSIKYDGAFKGCDGTTWVALSGGSGSTGGSAIFDKNNCSPNCPFTVPPGVTTINITAVGGGGGGGNGGGGALTGGGGGGGGGAGLTQSISAAVTQGTTYIVTIGNGGNATQAGSVTSVGTLLSATGGQPGGNGGNGNSNNPPYSCPGTGGGGGYGFASGLPGGDAVCTIHPDGYYVWVSSGNGGQGGASSDGVGGTQGNPGTGHGSGGGGGAGGASGAGGGGGGVGAPGKVTITW